MVQAAAAQANSFKHSATLKQEAYIKITRELFLIMWLASEIK